MADWTRSSLETRVTVLAARLDGSAFVDAIAELAATLDEDERTTLQEILLERAHADARAGAHTEILRRRSEPGWRRFLRRRRRRGADQR
jgi:hypothetical protein